MSSTDSVTVKTVVATDPETAFKIFTEDVDRWWKRGPKYRFNTARDGVIRFDPGVGGQLLEVYDDGDFFLVGKVLVWEPGSRLVFEWRARNFEPGQVTEVEVRFSPAPGGTQVMLQHRGWDGLPVDHPVRHGLSEQAFTSMMAHWWTDQLVAVVTHLQHRSGTERS